MDDETPDIAGETGTIRVRPRGTSDAKQGEHVVMYEGPR